jgi:hypothetical protein
MVVVGKWRVERVCVAVGNMARLEEVTIDTQGWKERRCEDSSKTGSVEEGRGKGKRRKGGGSRRGDTKHAFPHI